MRLDIYCAQYWPEQSRSTWQKLIKQGNVTVNDAVIDVPKHELGEDDHVQVTQPTTPDFSSQTLPIIYEDDNVIVINKPVGVLTHSKGALNDEFTVAEFVRPKTTYKSETNRPGIIHRLDRATSGIILTVKNDAAAKMLQKQFERRTVKKTYQALLVGTPKEHQAHINLPIGRNPKQPSSFRVDAGGKSAETTYDVIETSRRYSLVELRPRTGRTHQLRVHMQYIGTPIVGDALYGQSADRLYLHAYQLELTLPSGEHHLFTAPIPPDFQEKLHE